MKAITLWQPWASCIAYGAKQYETRSWSTNHRGDIAIHAAKRKVDIAVSHPAFEALFDAFLESGQQMLPPLPYGSVVAIAEIVDVHDTCPLVNQISDREKSVGDWRCGRYAWELANIRRLKNPVPARGYQGLWSWHMPHPSKVTLLEVAT